MPAGGDCGGCASSGKWVLHTVRLRGSYRRMCTDCVLKNHPSLFCPLCLVVFDKDSSPLPPPSDRVICHHCPSIAHRSCATRLNEGVLPPFFRCPHCSNPSFAFFDPTKRAIDLNLAKALLAAARIASTSIHRAAAAARVDADRCVKEAAFARKKAREALDSLSSLLMAKESHKISNKIEPDSSKKSLRLSENGVEGGKSPTHGLLPLSAIAASAAAAAAQRSPHAAKD